MRAAVTFSLDIRGKHCFKNSSKCPPTWTEKLFLIHLRKCNKYILFKLTRFSTTWKGPGQTSTSGNQCRVFPLTLMRFVVLLSADLRIIGRLATKNFSESLQLPLIVGVHTWLVSAKFDEKQKESCPWLLWCEWGNSPVVLGSVLSSSEQERLGHTGHTPEKGPKNI